MLLGCENRNLVALCFLFIYKCLDFLRHAQCFRFGRVVGDLDTGMQTCPVCRFVCDSFHDTECSVWRIVCIFHAGCFRTKIRVRLDNSWINRHVADDLGEHRLRDKARSKNRWDRACHIDDRRFNSDSDGTTI